jgi:ribosomal protein L1
MLEQQSTTTPTPATTTRQPAVSDLIESAREQARIAARIAESFDSLGDVSFSDLDLIARNCYAANHSLEAASRALADANESEAGQSTAVMVSSSEN